MLSSAGLRQKLVTSSRVRLGNKGASKKRKHLTDQLRESNVMHAEEFVASTTPAALLPAVPMASAGDAAKVSADEVSTGCGLALVHTRVPHSTAHGSVASLRCAPCSERSIRTNPRLAYYRVHMCGNGQVSATTAMHGRYGLRWRASHRPE